MYEVLPLAVEYQIKDIIEQCESYLEKNLSLKTLVIAEKYNLGQLKKSCHEMVKGKTLRALQAEPEYKLLSKENLEKMLMAKFNEMEEKANDYSYKYETLLCQNERNKKKLTLMKNELDRYQTHFFGKYTANYNFGKFSGASFGGDMWSQMIKYRDTRKYHLAECNFENSTGTNPGGDTWSQSNRCDYCLCEKLIKMYYN